MFCSVASSQCLSSVFPFFCKKNGMVLTFFFFTQMFYFEIVIFTSYRNDSEWSFVWCHPPVSACGEVLHAKSPSTPQQPILHRTLEPPQRSASSGRRSVLHSCVPWNVDGLNIPLLQLSGDMACSWPHASQANWDTLCPGWKLPCQRGHVCLSASGCGERVRMITGLHLGAFVDLQGRYKSVWAAGASSTDQVT